MGLQMDILKDLGCLAFGSRLKRLSDRLMQDGIKIYRHSGLDFEPKWFPVYYYLAQVGPSSVMEIARGVGITHPSVNQISKEMINRGYVAAYKDPKDKRKRVLALSSLGKAQRSALEKTWALIEQALGEVIAESGVDLLSHIGQLEAGLSQRSFEQRFLDLTDQQSSAIRIVPYQKKYAADFKRINQAWIETYFTMEDADRRALDDPEGYILARGGEIVFALDAADQVVGTCALVRHSSELGELAKMGVDPNSQTQGAGRRLGEAILELAVAKGFSTVFLETNSALKPAISLYKKLGFKTLAPPQSSDYQRADVYMEWQP
jgi:DNA-binding MarR family transcriptional regulator